MFILLENFYSCFLNNLFYYEVGYKRHPATTTKAINNNGILDLGCHNHGQVLIGHTIYTKGSFTAV